MLSVVILLFILLLSLLSFKVSGILLACTLDKVKMVSNSQSQSADGLDTDSQTEMRMKLSKEIIECNKQVSEKTHIPLPVIRFLLNFRTFILGRII